MESLVLEFIAKVSGSSLTLACLSLPFRFSEEGMEVMERLIYLYRKFNQLKVSNEEYACMKAINFLNQGEYSYKRLTK